MMASDYLKATDEQRAMILSQAETRLGDQHAFAQAADQRASTVTGALTALATAAGGVFAASITGEAPNWPLAAGGLVGAIGFGLAAHKALRSARCQAFHPRGYRPGDFSDDILNAKKIEQTRSEIAEDYDERLRFNAEILEERGRLIDQAMSIMLRTPIAIVVAAAIVAVLAGMVKTVAQ